VIEKASQWAVTDVGPAGQHEFADGEVGVDSQGTKGPTDGKRSDGGSRAHVPRSRVPGQRHVGLEAAPGMVRELHFAALRA